MPEHEREEARLRLALDKHTDSITRYWLRRLPLSDVDDVVAEVFAVAWRKLDAMPDAEKALPDRDQRRSWGPDGNIVPVDDSGQIYARDPDGEFYGPLVIDDGYVEYVVWVR